MISFNNKVALVTGASRGIGRAVAVMLAENGATVAVNYNRNQAAADETLNLLKGDGHILIQGDVADAQVAQQMIDSTVEQLGRIDILVNNAGIYTEHPIDEVAYVEWQAQWNAIISTNLLGAANLSYCVAQQMIKQGGGRIVNVSSRGAFRGEPESPAYGASKAGMNALGQSLAKKLAPHNIGVITVAPGWVATDMASDHLEDGIKQQSPFNRIATPEEVAYAVVMSAADEALFMSGGVIDVNGVSYLRT